MLAAVACGGADAAQTGQEAGRTKGEIKTQLIAHDQEVYDVSFSKGRAGTANTFATVGADGSVRMFDLRSGSCTPSSSSRRTAISTTRRCCTRTRPTRRCCAWRGTRWRTAATTWPYALDPCAAHLTCADDPHGRQLGGAAGRALAVRARRAAQQPRGLRQRHLLGAPLLVPHCHCRSAQCRAWPCSMLQATTSAR